jgi:hypothetical protein
MRVRVKRVEGRKLLVGNGGSKSKGKGWMSTVFKRLQSSINATPIPRISLIFDVEGCTIC